LPPGRVSRDRQAVGIVSTGRPAHCCEPYPICTIHAIDVSMRGVVFLIRHGATRACTQSITLCNRPFNTKWLRFDRHPSAEALERASRKASSIRDYKPANLFVTATASNGPRFWPGQAYAAAGLPRKAIGATGAETPSRSKRMGQVLLASGTFGVWLSEQPEAEPWTAQRLRTRSVMY